MNLDLLPVYIGLPLALLGGCWALARAARFVIAIGRGRNPSYTPPCTPTRQNTITGTPARRRLTVHAARPDFDQALQDAWKQVEVRKYEPLGK